MDDEYSQMKGELEDIEGDALWLRRERMDIEGAILLLNVRIRMLIARFARSDHPLKRERIIELRRLLAKLA